jgi:dihydrodipicolinate synthase/N-acetylneuraminate lyase
MPGDKQTSLTERPAPTRIVERLPLAGIIPPLITPLAPNGEFDPVGCGNLVRHVLAGGVQGVLVTGSNGEVAALDRVNRARAVDAVIAEVNGRVPVIVGVAQVCLQDVHAEVHQAAEAGAAAALVAPPYYAPVDTTAVRSFYLEVAERATLPVLVYNIPQFTKVGIPPDVISELAGEGAIAGVKDSSRDLDNLLHILEAVRGQTGFSVFTGSDSQIAAAFVMGVDGAIGVCGNLVPAWQVALFDAWSAGDLTSMRMWQERLFTLVRAVRVGSAPSAVKAALSIVGICGETCAPPVTNLTAAQRGTLAEALSHLGIVTTAPTAI